MRATRLVLTADGGSGRASPPRASPACHLGDRLRLRGGDRAPHAAGGNAGRPAGVAVLIFSVNSAELAKQVLARVGQSVLTAPGSACYSGLDAPEAIPLGKSLRFFGDGFQTSKQILGRRYWRVPVMDGEFVVEDSVGMVRGVGGGNLLVLGETAPRCWPPPSARSRQSAHCRT